MKEVWEKVIPVTGQIKRFLGDRFFFFFIRAQSVRSRCTTAYKAYRATLNPPCGLDIPTSATRCFHVHTTRETLAAKGGTVGKNVGRQFCLNVDFHVTFRDLLHAANLRHGTDGFTSPPKEGVLRIFTPQKNPDGFGQV
jgi:hypothetical protein